MPAQRTKVTERHARGRSSSPWVTDPGYLAARAAHPSTITSSNHNKTAVSGSANIVNSNPSFNVQSSSGAVVNYNSVTNFTAFVPHASPDIQAEIFAALKERYVPQAIYDAQVNPGCMDKTRTRILSEINAWITDPEALQICWITGMAGTGKTSIAKTVCAQAKANAEMTLGGSFFCSRSSGLAAQRDIRCVIPTLTQLLALKWADFRLAVAETIEPGVQYKEVSAQVKELLYMPLLALDPSRGPILFVIDALDECGGETSDGMLDDAKCHAAVTSMLEALVTITRSEPKLPVKFLVTSRPEAQIRDTPISDENISQILRLHTIESTEVAADINRYVTTTINTKLFGKPKLRAMITDVDVTHLVRLCDGLFIVAATALKHTFGAGADAAVARFKKLLNASRNSLDDGVAVPLDRMYAIILEDAVTAEEPHDTELPALLRLLSSLLAARMTLSIATLADLLGLESYDVRASLSRLHAVVNVPDDDDVPGLRTVHASFGDYLFDRAPSHIRILRSSGHEFLARACLELMGMCLHFNVSRSRSSYEPNASTKPDHITLSLEYACLHWAHHINFFRNSHSHPSSDISFDADIGRSFRPKFMFWLEVLSVLHKVGLASGLLLMASSSVRDTALFQFLQDANVFVASSREAIERSAPHIYLSALPFANKHSLVYQDFCPQSTGLITVDTFGICHHGGSALMTLTSHGGAVHSVAYSSDGRLLASGTADGTVRIWNAATGEDAMSPLRSSDGSVRSVAFARNNKWIASGTESGIVCVWNITQVDAVHRRLIAHSESVTSVAFTPDSSRLASASKDKTARIWNPTTGEQLLVLTGHTQSVNGVVFSQDGRLLASVSRDRSIRLWHSTSGRAAREPIANAGVFGVDFSSDGEIIAGSFSNAVALWKHMNAAEITSLPMDAQFARFSPGGRSLVAAYGQDVRLWTMYPDHANAPWVDLRGHTGKINWATFSPDNRYVASASEDSTIRIWNAGSGQAVVDPLPAHVSSVYSVAVSFDGSFIVSGSLDNSIRVWNAWTGGKTLPPLHGHTNRVRSVTISPDGSLIASASADNTVRLWDVKSGVSVGEPMSGHADFVMAVTFSHDGCRLASASEDCTVRLWDVKTRQMLAIGPLRCRRWVWTVAFSYDDQHVAAGDTRGYIYLWRTDTGEQSHELSTSTAQITSLAFSQAGTHIVSGGKDDMARVWNLNDGQPSLVLKGHTGSVRSVAWSIDGRFICTCSNDRTVRLWDAVSGASLAILHGHTEAVRSVVFTSNGESIISGSEDFTIRKWDVEAACQLASDSRLDSFARIATARLDNGWLVGSSGELLLWVPAEYRNNLQVHPCTLLINRSRVVIGVGDSNLHVGSNWTSCWLN